METEAAASTPSRRPRPVILVLLGAAVAAFLLLRLVGSSDQGARSSTTARAPQRPGAADAVLDPAAFDVRLEALEQERPGFGETERNPFRFQPKPPPPAPVQPPGAFKPAAPEETDPQGPPPPPPITVKFIGTMVLPDGLTVAIFTDCTVGRSTTPVREGQIIFGQYRLVKIGLQSVVVEHLDGRGRTTLPKGGQECVK